MINNQRTFEVFGYYTNDLAPKSNKRVVHICNECGKERFLAKQVALKIYLCKSCSNKINGLKVRNINLSGVNNSNYIDGRTLKQYFCKYPGCNNQISVYSALYGKHHCSKHFVSTEERNKNVSLGLRKLDRKGNKASNYIDGRTPLILLIRGCIEYHQWRNNVYLRDNFTCQKCYLRADGKLNVHHKKSFIEIFNKFSPIEDKETLLRLATKHEPFWDFSNGITLCEDCHKKEHSSSTMSRSE